MKKIYEIPEVTVFNVGVPECMIAGSPGVNDGYGSDGEEQYTNSNYMDDDQSTPWYRR